MQPRIHSYTSHFIRRLKSLLVYVWKFIWVILLRLISWSENQNIFRKKIINISLIRLWDIDMQFWLTWKSKWVDEFCGQCCKSWSVTGVTTPFDNILSNLYMYLDVYDRRSYSMLRFRLTVARISRSVWLRSASRFLSSCWRRLIFLAFLSCFLDVGKGFTWPCCAKVQSRMDSWTTLSGLSTIRSNHWSSVRSLRVVDTDFSLSTCETRSGWTCWRHWFWSGTCWFPSVEYICGETLPWSRSVSISIISSGSSPIILASHQTQWATNIFWVLLA